jgi:hypothetical protein
VTEDFYLISLNVMGYFCVMHVVLESFLNTEIFRECELENDMFVFGIGMFSMEW